MQNQKNSIGLQIFKSFCNEQKQTYFHKMNDDILSHVYSYLTYDNINDINVYYDKLVFKKGEKKIINDRISMNWNEFVKSFYCTLYYKKVGNKNDNEVIPYLRNDAMYFKQETSLLDDTMIMYNNKYGYLTSLLSYLAIDEYVQKDKFFVIYFYNKNNSLCKLLNHYLTC